MGNSIAVGFLTHQFNESISHRFARLHAQLAGYADCFVRLQDDGGPVIAAWKKFLNQKGLAHALMPFVPAELPRQLGYAFYGDREILGNTHFPMLAFARSAQSYQWFWQIESDVEYRGNWRDFLQAFEASDAPFLASHIHRFEDWPTWTWWSTLAAPGAVKLDADKRFKAFMPVFRMSREAVAATHNAHDEGWSGHFEVSVPTALAHAGLEVGSLRNVTRCYVGGSQNPQRIIPLQSTMRWRPPITAKEFMARDNGPLLFHPVKRNWAFDGEKVVRWADPPEDPNAPVEDQKMGG